MKAILALLRRVVARLTGRGNVSAGYELNPANPAQLAGWTEEGVAERQHRAFAPLIEQAMSGSPRLDFRVAADVIAMTEERNPIVLEVGCGSGYYSMVLPVLLGGPIRYVGVDYSPAMTSLAQKCFPGTAFAAADALALPFAAGSCDIAFSGTSLMHIPNYRSAIAEMVRVSRRWCVFHTVPVISKRATITMSKLAYGARVPEIVFNRSELEGIFIEHGLTLRHTRESFPYDVSSVVGEPTPTLSYLCEKK